MNKQKLILEQIDRQLLQLKNIENLSIPSSGWIKAIRKSLGMSLRQLGNRMGITAQSVKEIEERELYGTISVKVLKQFGNALNMKLVYGFIPVESNLESMIDQRAMEIAREIVQRTSISMKLEDQENEPARIKHAISEKANDLKMKMPRYLWD
jgi:predicted DNA-binding mobile mystery protein A